jgi:hypothetical protein
MANAVFRRLLITVNIAVADRDVLDSAGQPVLGSFSTDTTLYHWAAPEAASAWVAQCRADLNAAKANRSITSLDRVATGIMQVYNCANVQWHMDPLARALHRQWVAGPPMKIGTSLDLAQFSPSFPYNASVGNGVPVTFVDTNGHPVTVDTVPDGKHYVDSSGTLAARAAQAMRQFSPDPNGAKDHPAQFAQAYQFIADVPGYERNDPGAISYGDEAAIMGAESLENQVNGAVSGFGGVFNIYNHGSDPANAWTNRSFDWPAVMFGTPPLLTSASAADYAEYFEAWVSALESRTIEQIIADARLYTAYYNAMQVRALGGDQMALIRRVTQSIDEQLSADPNVVTDVRAAGAATVALATGIGAAAGSVIPGLGTAVGGALGGLIGGAVSVITTVVSQSDAIPRDTSRLRLDDLLRWKPIYERGWLSGDPSRGDAAAAPSLSVPMPAAAPASSSGGSINVGAMLRNIRPGVLNAATITKRPAPVPAFDVAGPSAPMSTGAKVALGLGGGAAAWFAWRAFRKAGR